MDLGRRFRTQPAGNRNNVCPTVIYFKVKSDQAFRLEMATVQRRIRDQKLNMVIETRVSALIEGQEFRSSVLHKSAHGSTFDHIAGVMFMAGRCLVPLWLQVNSRSAGTSACGPVSTPSSTPPTSSPVPLPLPRALLHRVERAGRSRTTCHRAGDTPAHAALPHLRPSRPRP